MLIKQNDYNTADIKCRASSAYTELLTTFVNQGINKMHFTITLIDYIVYIYYVYVYSVL